MTLPSKPSSVVKREASDIVMFRRDDLAALAVSSQHARPNAWRSAVPPASGILTFVALIGLHEGLGWAFLTTPLCIGVGTAMWAATTLKAWHTERTRRAEFAYDCPQCGLEIVSRVPGTEDGPRAALVIASGCCPGCGQRIVAD